MIGRGKAFAIASTRIPSATARVARPSTHPRSVGVLARGPRTVDPHAYAGAEISLGRCVCAGATLFPTGAGACSAPSLSRYVLFTPQHCMMNNGASVMKTMTTSSAFPNAMPRTSRRGIATSREHACGVIAFTHAHKLSSPSSS
eukprot:29122-Pelagococcus_subviridis.AAC.3